MSVENYFNDYSDAVVALGLKGVTIDALAALGVPDESHEALVNEKIAVFNEIEILGRVNESLLFCEILIKMGIAFAKLSTLQHSDNDSLAFILRSHTQVAALINKGVAFDELSVLGQVSEYALFSILNKEPEVAELMDRGIKFNELSVLGQENCISLFYVLEDPDCEWIKNNLQKKAAERGFVQGAAAAAFSDKVPFEVGCNYISESISYKDGKSLALTCKAIIAAAEDGRSRAERILEQRELANKGKDIIG